MKGPTTGQAHVPNVDHVVQSVVQGLRRFRDPAKAAQSRKYFKGEIVALGVDAPTLRSFIKGQARPLARTWTLAEAVECCDRLLAEPELEIQAAGLLLLGAFKKGFTLDLLTPADRWLGTRLNNWALVDGFCGAVLSPLLERYPEVEKTLRVWSKDESLWVRRAALVTLVPFARWGDLLDTTYELAAEHFRDPEDLMHKAMGWLLREAGKTDAERLRRFLLKHGPAIPRTSLRCAIERYAPAERKRLLEETR